MKYYGFLILLIVFVPFIQSGYGDTILLQDFVLSNDTVDTHSLDVTTNIGDLLVFDYTVSTDDGYGLIYIDGVEKVKVYGEISDIYTYTSTITGIKNIELQYEEWFGFGVDDSFTINELTLIGVDITPPIITLTGDNPQTIELGDGYTELDATTDDGSPITIDDDSFVDVIGSYSILYDSVDDSGNPAIQVIRTVVVSTISIPENNGYSFIGVTSNGVEFPIIPLDVSENSIDSVGDGDSILDGLGVYLTIQNIGTNGVVYFGEDGTNHSAQTDIRQYVETGIHDDWVIAIPDDDYSEVFSVPEFGVEYEYISGSLVNVTESEPNVFGYSESRILSGDVIVTSNDEGIQFTSVSGDGEIILKLNDYDGQNLFLKGDVDTGNTIKIITSDIDLINDSYYSDGYLTYSASIDPGTNSFSVTAGIDSIHTGILDYTVYFDYDNQNQYGNCFFDISDWIGFDLDGTPSGGRDCHYEYPWSMTTSLVKTNQIDHYTITGDNTTPEVLSDVSPVSFVTNEATSSYYFELYDTLPSVQLAGFSDGGFEQLLEFPSEQTYLYVKLDGSGNGTIKGEAFDPEADVFFKVVGLPADIAYDITKSGITGIVGKTSSNGEISLLSNDVDFGVSSPGGILTIYPDSVTYIGDLGIGMIDLYNEYSIPLSTGDDMAYIPQNYVYWVFPVEVEFENVMIDGIAINYLNKNYTKNEAVLIPVIPGANIIYATINGEDVEVLMRDVSSTTQTKQVPIESTTTSSYGVDEPASTSSNISTSTFLTATHTGTMYVNLDFQVGGSVEFTMDSTYTGGFSTSQSCSWHGASSPSRSYSCQGYSTPNNPASITNMISLTAEQQTRLTVALNNGQLSNLTVEVDIIRNMGAADDAESYLIYTSNSAEAYSTSTLSIAGYDASSQVYVTYPMSTVTGNIAIPVTVGDMMEIVVLVNLDVSGAPVPASESASYLSYVQATTELGGGVITVGMS